MENIAVLIGSPRKNGNTEMLCDAFIKGAEAVGNTVQKIHLSGRKIGGCLGCDYCLSHGGECVQKDDMRKVYDALYNSDMLVLATPLYYWGFSAQIKTVIDRFYASLAKSFPISSAVLLITCGADKTEECDAAVAHYRAFTHGMNWLDKGIVAAEGVLNKGDIVGHRALEEAERLGETLK